MDLLFFLGFFFVGFLVVVGGFWKIVLVNVLVFYLLVVEFEKFYVMFDFVGFDGYFLVVVIFCDFFD